MKKLLLTTALALLFGSVSARHIESKGTIYGSVIDIAINNFLKSGLSRSYEVFIVFVDTMKYDAKHCKDDSLITVVIVPEERHAKYYVSTIDTLGNSYIPTGHIVRGGKLFYWYDKTELTQETIDAFVAFKLAEIVNVSEPIMLMSIVHNDGLKSISYYFCKSDITRYKRVVDINRRAKKWNRQSRSRRN